MSDETKPEPGGLLAEQAAAMAAGGVGLGAAVGVAQTLGGAMEPATTKSGIGQYLIAGGGGQQHDNVMGNAVVSALNRLAGFKSRL